MNVIGQTVTVMDATDQTKKGRSGEVVLETAKTLLLSARGGTIMVEKKGTVLLLAGSKIVVSGDDLAGRLEDRLRSRKR